MEAQVTARKQADEHSVNADAKNTQQRNLSFMSKIPQSMPLHKHNRLTSELSKDRRVR